MADVPAYDQATFSRMTRAGTPPTRASASLRNRYGDAQGFSAVAAMRPTIFERQRFGRAAGDDLSRAGVGRRETPVGVLLVIGRRTLGKTSPVGEPRGRPCAGRQGGRVRPRCPSVPIHPPDRVARQVG